MPLILAPMRLEDFDTIQSHADIYEPGEDLVANPVPMTWPVSTREEAQHRLKFVMNKQRRRFQHDPTTRFMKVVDAPSEDRVDDRDSDIISVARWHYYPSGYDYDTMVHWEQAERLPGEDWPASFNWAMNDFILTSRDRLRASWHAEGAPAWILTHMVTRKSQRGRGAAGMLVRWGIEQSEKMGVPAYLEAGVQGVPVYKRYGFEQVGELRERSLQPYGSDTTFNFTTMVRYPSGGMVAPESNREN